MKFSITAEDGMARRGVLKVNGKRLDTPAFIPVATLASVRGLDGRDLKEMGVQAVIANTYHLHMKPGDELIREYGGIHRFMSFDGIVMSDSGGFQAFSLGFGKEHGVGKIANNIFLEGLREVEFRGERWAYVDDDGVTFRDPLYSRKVRLTPERSMEIQSNLGSDIIFAFDECTSPLSDYEYTKKAMERTHRWALRCLESYDRRQKIFGIVQGGEYKDLRVASARFISSLPFDGFGIGGSLGKSKRDMLNILEWVIPELDPERPRHLLGIGGIDDIFESVERGMDTFDCVTPTRWARRGVVFISPESGGSRRNKFRIHIKRSEFRLDHGPIDQSCDCFVCQTYSKAYLRHLFKANELTFFRLASYHNVPFMMRLMERIRESIESGAFQELKRKWLGQ
ncbi:tRNA guanosine(34) transglycosylase Tgt [Geoglobus ahangari]|uniref:tRNA guanosine(34) transglycosylase Tgt n=1 Tax=Geoglobus ahangari TaxID=113653 RepID=UPI001FE2394E|nr:tRNA guanosine(34) transglycosylase Tgt [Geoglobus ahangari]